MAIYTARKVARECGLSLCQHPSRTIKIGEQYSSEGRTWQGRMAAAYFHPDCQDMLDDHLAHDGSWPGAPKPKACRLCNLKSELEPAVP